MTTRDKDTPAYIERNFVPIVLVVPASGMTFQQWAQKNRLDKSAADRVTEIVQAGSTEHDPED
jgi:hypothetical protein